MRAISIALFLPKIKAPTDMRDEWAAHVEGEYLETHGSMHNNIIFVDFSKEFPFFSSFL